MACLYWQRYRNHWRPRMFCSTSVNVGRQTMRETRSMQETPFRIQTPNKTNGSFAPKWAV
eukprot:6860501-Lingulodinium_polyedra.AAC.1